jgi:hypothetical protein
VKRADSWEGGPGFRRGDERKRDVVVGVRLGEGGSRAVGRAVGGAVAWF